MASRPLTWRSMISRNVRWKETETRVWVWSKKEAPSGEDAKGQTLSARTPAGPPGLAGGGAQCRNLL